MPRRVNWFHDLIEDLRSAVRMLRENLGFALIATFTLAFRIGANTANEGASSPYLEFLNLRQHPQAFKAMLCCDTNEYESKTK